MVGDFRDALRSILKRPAGSLVIVAILGSAIAVATVLGSLFAALVDYLPSVDSPDAIVRVWRADDGRPAGHREPSAGDFLAWKDGARTLTALTASVQRNVIIGGADGRTVMALLVSADYFNLAGRRPQFGRVFDPDDMRGGDVAIISDRLWRERFNGDSGVVGRTLAVDVRPREIVGVMPAGFWLPSPGVDVWLPSDPDKPAELVDIVGRLRPGATLEQAQSEFDVLAQRASGRADDPRNNRTLLRTFRGEAVATVRPRIQALVAPALVLLLIACANVGNLLVIRMMSRERELAIRAALGATAARLARLSLVETALLGVCGGLAGLLLAAWGLKPLQVGMASAIPAMAGSMPIGRFLPAIAAIAAALTLVGTSVLSATTALRRDISSSLAGQQRKPISARFRYSVGDLLVLLQVGLAVVLVLTSAMLIRVFAEFGTTSRPAVDPSVYVAQLVTPADIDSADRLTRYQTVLDEVAGVGAVQDVALSSQIPAPGGEPTRITAAGASGSRECQASIVFVSRRYFDTLGIRIERGAIPGTGESVVVSTTASRKCWNDASSGEWRMRISGASGGWLPVVAVAADLAAPLPPHLAFLRRGETAVAWVVGRREWPDRMYLLIRPHMPGRVSVVDIARAVNRASDAVAMEPLARLVDVIEAHFAGSALVIATLAVVSAIALVLAFTGVYAALSQSCSLRLVELGVRLALGADPWRLVAATVAHDVPLVLIGIIAGLTGTLWVTRMVWPELLWISATEPRLWLAVCGVLGAAGFLASVGPAVRAIRVDPMTVLRSE